MFRIGSGAGFSGDRVDAAQSVVAEIAAAGEGGAIIFETMGERTLALGQIARRTDPDKGYEPLLEEIVTPILRTCIENNIAIVSNFGCANPPAAARLLARIAREQGLGGIRIGIVEGDDLLGRIGPDQMERWDGDGRLPAVDGELIAVNAYLGARAIADALNEGAQIVVTGRVADPALVVGPLVAHFGWDMNDLDRIAAGTLVGHLLECGSQVSGGFYADPGVKDVPRPAEIGFPIAEVEQDGTFVITKAVGTGGVVNLKTVKEQILYEIHDPAAYLTPDVTLDLSEVEIAEIGPDRVQVIGAKGHKAPEKLKATLCYEGDWFGEAAISYAGPNSAARAKLAVEIIHDRLKLRNLDVQFRADIVGLASCFDSAEGTLRQDATPAGTDFRVRFAFSSHSERDVRAAVQDVGALYCCGPAGGGGIRSSVRARLTTQSYLVPRDLVPSHFVMAEEV